MGARYQNGKTGTFLSQDPAFLRLGSSRKDLIILVDPQKLNSYSYAINNPIRFTDPTGESAWDYVVGLTNGLISNNFMGAGRVPASSYNGNRIDYQKGQSTADTVSILQGIAEINAGLTAQTGGTVLALASGGTLVVPGVAVAALGAGAVTHGAAVAGMGAYNLAQDINGNNPNSIVITNKISGQMSTRGWTKESIEALKNNPSETGKSINRATGNDASVYFRDDGHYVVVDNKTSEVVQISDTNRNIGNRPNDWKVDRDIKKDN